jgi:hypothetical protein
MKTKILVISAFMIMFVANAIGADFNVGSGIKTGSTIISSKPGVVKQIIVTSASTDAITVDLYDNTAASGTSLIPTWVIPAQSTAGGISYLPISDERYGTALYVSIAGSGGFKYVVIYKEDR